ncbi:MAG: ubiquinol-cytochrome c reductase iron-sulfur subunit [Bacteroidota bacterium]
MDRKEFLKTCGYSCLGLIGVSVFLDSCTTQKLIQAESVNNVIRITKTEFVDPKKNKPLRYITVKTNSSDFPIIVYRFSENEYKALLLRCTHLGSELNVNGDLLTCPAHGSEFSNKGEIVQGPADKNLESYTITSDIKNIYIHLA